MIPLNFQNKSRKFQCLNGLAKIKSKKLAVSPRERRALQQPQARLGFTTAARGGPHGFTAAAGGRGRIMGHWNYKGNSKINGAELYRTDAP